jgi:hypothetical protein
MLGHQFEDLFAGIVGSGDDRVAHGPRESAGNSLPLVRAVLGVDRSADVHPLHGDTQRGSCHLHCDCVGALPKFLPPDGERYASVLIEANPG